MGAERCWCAEVSLMDCKLGMGLEATAIFCGGDTLPNRCWVGCVRCDYLSSIN